MSSMFVSGKVAITASGVTDEKDLTDASDVIFIRTKMDFGTRQRVIGAAAKMIEQQGAATRRSRRAAKSAAPKFDFDVGAYQIALLVQNIVGWAGPKFHGVACVPANIERLNPDEPLVQMTLKEISERNTPVDEPADDDDVLELDAPNVIEVTATS